MTVQAEWNKEKFGRTANALRNLESFEISCGIETEEKAATNGVKKTVVKGLAAEELKISFKAGFPVGTDPRQEFQDFKKIADKGKSENFYLGSKNVGVGEFMLDQVELSDVQHGNTGRFYSGKISLSFSQDVNVKSKKEAKK